MEKKESRQLIKILFAEPTIEKENKEKEGQIKEKEKEFS